MGFYDTFLLPRLVHLTCGQKPAMKQREKVVPLAEGRVLEIGIGSGLNLPYYDAARVTHLWGLDPSSAMWKVAGRQARKHGIRTEFIESGAESIPLESRSADCVVSTYTLCTVPDVSVALDEIRRVLKPGGKLIFCEHGEAPDTDVQRWQDLVNPLWKRMAGGCHLNRPIPVLLEDAGFRSGDLQTMYIPGWKPACFNFWGTALNNRG